jgi:hypothetical protein
MQFFSNRPDILTDVIWFRAEPGVPFVPYLHNFASSIWDDPHEKLPDAVGEVWQSPPTWYNGAAPAHFPGVTPCGSASDWQNGVNYPPSPLTTIPPDWVPTCCSGGPPPVDPCTALSWAFQISGATGPTSPYNHFFFSKPTPDGPCFWTNEVMLGNGFWSISEDTSVLPNLWNINGFLDPPSNTLPFWYTIPKGMVNATILGSTTVPINMGHPQAPGLPPTITLVRVS